MAKEIKEINEFTYQKFLIFMKKYEKEKQKEVSHRGKYEYKKALSKKRNGNTKNDEKEKTD